MKTATNFTTTETFQATKNGNEYTIEQRFHGAQVITYKVDKGQRYKETERFEVLTSEQFHSQYTRVN